MATQSARKSAYPAIIPSGKVESSSLPMISASNPILFRTRAVWITDLFPDELVIQQKTVSIIHNRLLVSYVETMPIKDIGRVVFINIPFFASIEILGKNTAHNLGIKGLKKQQAWQAKSILEGLLLENPNSGDEEVHWSHIEENRRHNYKFDRE